MMKKTVHLLTIILIAAISSCKSSKKVIAEKPLNSSPMNSTSTASEHLYMHRWDLTEVGGKRVNAEAGRRAYLLFTAGKVNTVAGFTGCNRLTGKFDLSADNKIQFSPLAITKMACLNDNGTESDFLKAINTTNKWAIDEKILSFYNGETIVAKFTAVDAAVASKLEGVWEMNYISGQRIAFEGLYPNKKPTISFDLASGEIYGNSGCNVFGAPFTIEGANIAFKDGRSTLMACEGNGERAFFDMLKKVNRYNFADDDKTLNLLMGDVPVMRFTKK